MFEFEKWLKTSPVDFIAPQFIANPYHQSSWGAPFLHTRILLHQTAIQEPREVTARSARAVCAPVGALTLSAGEGPALMLLSGAASQIMGFSRSGGGAEVNFVFPKTTEGPHEGESGTCASLGPHEAL